MLFFGGTFHVVVVHSRDPLGSVMVLDVITAQTPLVQVPVHVQSVDESTLVTGPPCFALCQQFFLLQC